MSAFLSEISAFLPDAKPPRDPTGALLVLRDALEPLGPLLVFAAGESGEIVACDARADEECATEAQSYANILAAAVANASFAAVPTPAGAHSSATLVGVRVRDHEGGAALAGALVRRAEPALFCSAGWQQTVAAQASAAWIALRTHRNLEEADTRVRHLLAEQETLRKAHSEIVERILQEREERLQEKRSYIAHLESEVRKRSLALQEAVERAEQANKAKSEFLANMSHEIRTPMNAVLGFADTLLDPGLSDAERRDAVETIRRNGEHLLAIINDILDLSKIEAGKLTVETRRCCPAEIVATVADLARARLKEKKIALESEYASRIPETIATDPTRLRQILINLVGNSIKFTETGGVRIVTRLVQDAGAPPLLQFDVVDTGIGMTADQMERLFQPFSQADASTTRRFGGTGLGLVICKRLVQMLGGDIRMQSTPGLGSTFSFAVATGSLDGVPLLEPGEIGKSRSAASEAAAAATAEAPKLSCRVLLAEDGPDNQRLITIFLKKTGAEVAIVGNGRLAADAALAAQEKGEPFDVILMDMQMPVLDGYEATRELRSKGYTRPIIALTAHAMATDRAKCLQAGCDDFATKPIDRKTLIETIQRNLKRVRDDATAAPSAAPAVGV